MARARPGWKTEEARSHHTELQEVEGVVGAPAEEEGDDDGQDDLEGLLGLGQAVARVACRRCRSSRRW